MRWICLIALVVIAMPIRAYTGGLLSVPKYDGSLLWEASIEKVLDQIYEDLRKIVRPAEGRVSSNFGMRDHPVLGIKRHHNGIDIACKVGTPIRAVLSGVVKIAGSNGGYGKMVEVAHQFDSMKTRYAHMSKILVKTGDGVEKGELIGYSGMTGFATGPHLHFELFKNGKVVDPRLILERGQAYMVPRL
jgi:murein DD-endopeptidase MepM/ murein hydrolase activator NlpD